MKAYCLLLAGLFTSASVAAQSDPFVGTWIYNSQKSPKPTITYGIKDLGGDRYALTGSTGETTEIKADGVSIKSLSGATVSFKKLDEHTWQMDRFENRKMVRTYTVSADDNTLTLHDIFTATNGSKEELTTTYARKGSGKSLFGEWESVRMVETISGKPDGLVIRPYGKDGLTFTWEGDKAHTDMKFDGKQYLEMAPDSNGNSCSGKRINANLIQRACQTAGKPADTQEVKVSEDGKILTMASKSLKTSTVFTSIWDKQ